MKPGRYFRARVRALLAEQLTAAPHPDLQQVVSLLTLIYRSY